ncbi:hypothetical protein [Puniceibacterium confluentis]|uniref:hypothetical protein n=1 Tax=Puniceibacterium confluentis TaxID=1958944 RepID=UPI001646747B|nr:hypothetical protein [Puniceibacterium confluentis]
MEQKSRQPKTSKDHRDARLKAALKANLARRKAQARARDGEKPQPEGAEKDKG